MSFSAVVNSVVVAAQKNLLIALAATVLLIYLLLRKPKTFLIIFSISILLIGILYLSSSLSSCKSVGIWQ
jgi:uncharacterized membrane protein